MSATTLGRVYSKGKVKFKFIIRIKKEIDNNVPYYRGLFDIMLAELKKVKEKKMKLIFIDEAVFSFNTFSTKAWSSAYTSISVRDANIRIKA